MSMQEQSYILSGPEDDYDIPKESLGKTIYKILQKRNPEDIVNIDARTLEVLRCGELLEKSKKYADLYKKMGILKGDTISIISENSLQYFVAVIGAFYMGIAVNLINPSYSVGELERYLSITQPKLILSSETASSTILQVKDILQIEAPVLLMTPQSNQDNSGTSDPRYAENLFEMADNSSFQPLEFDYADQVAIILFSSGTTGLPKGVMLTHQNLRMGLGMCIDPKYGDVIPGDNSIIVAPYYHIYGTLIQLVGIITSTKCVIMDKFKPELFLDSIQKHQITKLYTVPSLLLFIVQSPLVKDYSLSSVRHIFVGGAPLPADAVIQIHERYPSVKVRHLYGLTEVSGPCTLQTKKEKIKSVGYLGPGVIAKVIDPDTKKLLGPLELGELCFKGPLIMKGYLPKQDYLDEDGFFKSGDAGYYDQDGDFYVVERYKELIKYKAFQVSPAELEALIMTHSAVEDCGVVGAPDERCGEVAVALVVLKENVNCTEQEILDFVAERISFQKRLHGGVKFIKEIPRTPVGKMMRKALKEMI